jgi:hypothetical protein
MGTTNSINTGMGTTKYTKYTKGSQERFRY